MYIMNFLMSLNITLDLLAILTVHAGGAILILLLRNQKSLNRRNKVRKQGNYIN